jgi:hypothetical protein
LNVGVWQMAEITFEELLEAAQKLSPEKKAALVATLQRTHISKLPTREQVLAEHQARIAAGAFRNVKSMRNKYANPNAPEMSEEELHNFLREIGKEWEEELDDTWLNT